MDTECYVSLTLATNLEVWLSSNSLDLSKKYILLCHVSTGMSNFLFAHHFWYLMVKHQRLCANKTRTAS